MFDKKHIPNLYKQLHKLGYLDINKHFVWMPEMEWMPYEEVINYEYEEGITQEVLPFAFTGGGDKWVFIENGTTEPYIGRYYHPEDDGEYCTKNFEDAILLNIIEFAAAPAIWLDKNGKIRREEYSEQEMQNIMKEYGKIYEGMLCQKYLDIIAYLSTLSFKRCTFHNYGHWLALLSSWEADTMIKQYLYFEQMDKTFVWYLDG